MRKAKLKIYGTAQNNVRVKLNLGFDDEGYTWIRGMKQHIRKNSGKDKKEYPLIIEHYGILEEFLDLNEINDSAIYIDENSIDTFYVFQNYESMDYFHKLTPDVVELWWNYDCPDIFRFKVNKKRETNGWGLNLICWENKLAEVHYNGVYFGDPEKEELKKLMEGHRGTTFYEEARAYIKSQDFDDNHQKALERVVKEYEKNIQKIIDEHADDILNKLDGEYFTIVNENNEQKIIPNNYGLDCGFLNIYSRNEQYKEAKRILYNLDSEYGKFKWMQLKLPYSPQSLTIQKAIFDEVKKVVMIRLEEELYCETILD